MANRIAFIGLGVMGYPMAGHLARGGHHVVVFNRTVERAERWVAEYGGRSAPTPAGAAEGAEFVLACVGRDSDVREVTTAADGAFSAMQKGAVFVDHTTASAGLARELAEDAEARGFGFVDAPISGGEAGAKNGQLTIMCGGDEAAYAKAEPILKVYARQCRRLGPAGAGQLTKMVNQICIAGVVQGLSEGLSFARAAGLDPEAVIEVISKGAAQSWQMENRYKTMLADHFEHGFAVEWMRKDLAICLDESRRNGASLPLTALVDQFYADVENVGGKRWDTSSLFARLEHLRNTKAKA
ncbi:MAG TPA: NAD(P)-dependent oxidoreductase [Rhizomicrobium sp.]|jgi:3-hydroxyisobutyrate dehydrogenase|nr:NAD(P)-dependent oxidoreductase [Rhizomicrobium sp.]